MKKKYTLVALLLIVLFSTSFFAGCSPEKGTDITEKEAEIAAEQIRESAESTLSSFEEVYLYALPAMLEVHGIEVLDMDAESYFSKVALLLKDNSVLLPDDDMIEKMSQMEIDVDNGTFTMENFTAGMSVEIAEIPVKALALLMGEQEAQDGNGYLEKARNAYKEAII